MPSILNVCYSWSCCCGLCIQSRGIKTWYGGLVAAGGLLHFYIWFLLFTSQVTAPCVAQLFLRSLIRKYFLKISEHKRGSSRSIWSSCERDENWSIMATLMMARTNSSYWVFSSKHAIICQDKKATAIFMVFKAKKIFLGKTWNKLTRSKFKVWRGSFQSWVELNLTLSSHLTYTLFSIKLSKSTHTF